MRISAQTLALVATLAVAAPALADSPGACRHAAIARMADGQWRSAVTSKGADGRPVSNDRPFSTRRVAAGVLEMAGPDGVMFLRMTQTDDGYRFDEPGADGKLVSGQARVVQCSAPDANGYQIIVETTTEAGEDGKPVDTLSTIVAGPDVVTITGAIRPVASQRPFAWASTMTVYRSGL